MKIDERQNLITHSKLGMFTIDYLVRGALENFVIDVETKALGKSQSEERANPVSRIIDDTAVGLEDKEGDRLGKFIAGLILLVDEPSTNIEVAETMAGDLKVHWDETAFRNYIRDFHKKEYGLYLIDSEQNFELLGMVSGIFEAIEILKGLRTKLGNEERLPEIYGTVGAAKFIESNIEQMLNAKEAVFEMLVISYNSKVATDKKSFVESEIVEFERLFISGQEGVDWSYVSQRIGLEEDAVNLIYTNRTDVMLNQYHSNLFSFDKSNLNSSAILLAVREYLSFLRSEINRPRLYESLKEKIQDDRIMLSQAGRNFMESCFVNLAQSKDGKSDVDEANYMMTTDDVNHLIQANFAGFGDPVEKRLLDFNFENKTHLAHFIGRVLRPLIKTEGCIITLDDITVLIQSNFRAYYEDSDAYIKKLTKRHINLNPNLEKALLVNHEKTGIKSEDEQNRLK